MGSWNMSIIPFPIGPDIQYKEFFSGSDSFLEFT